MSRKQVPEVQANIHSEPKRRAFMKSVTITFLGHRSDDVAERFYTWVVDGGLEDSIIDTLSNDGVEVQGILDINNDSLSLAIVSTEPSER
jgi:hypothetical protein